ncbi:uncharacterized protein [Argopecten irradians]|uniref:uncharacterized protein n=1 Tax=Argopecten irradians TaxID=31199 RepID=UPI003711F4EF
MLSRTKGLHKCDLHSWQNVIFVCEDCTGRLICVDCVSDHPRHRIIKLDDVIPEKEGSIQSYIRAIDRQRIPKIQDEIDIVNYMLEENKKHYDDMVERAEIQGQNIKAEVEEQTIEFTKTFRQMEKQNSDRLLKYKYSLLGTFREMDDQLQESKHTLQKGSKVQIYDFERDKAWSGFKLPDRPVSNLTEFKVNTSLLFLLRNQKLTTGTLTNTSGVQQDANEMEEIEENGDVLPTWKVPQKSSLKAIKPKEAPSHPRPEISAQLSSFQHLYPVKAICPTSEGAWILAGNNSKATLVAYEGSKIEGITVDEDQAINDIAVSPTTGHLWLCCKDMTIKIVRLKRHRVLNPVPEDLLQTNDVPISICVTDNGMVIVGFQFKSIFYSEADLEAAPKVSLNFPHPFRIASNPISGQIAVLHAKSCLGPEDEELRVTILESGLPTQSLNKFHENPVIKSSTRGLSTSKKRKDMLSGQHCVSIARWIDLAQSVSPIELNPPSPQVFLPADMTYDSLGNIIVADYLRSSIDLLSAEGRFLRTLLKTIEACPMSVGVQNNNVLWVGFADGKVKRYRYA